MLYVLLGAIAIGLVLGLLGSGGSILTIPVLVYLADQPDKIAIAESLAIVGTIAAVGMLPYARQRSVDWQSVLYFGVPALAGTYGGAALSNMVPGAIQLVIFATVILLAAVFMLRGRAHLDGEHARQAVWKIAAQGVGTGVLTGLVGVGGGFLIVPALVLLGGLSMRMAVGTSLFIIAMNSVVGFLKHLDLLADHAQRVDWGLIGLLAAVGIVGSLIGHRVSQHVPQATLRRGFAGFLVLMGVFMLAQEAPEAFAASRNAAVPAGTLRGDSTEVPRLAPAEFAARLDAAGPDAIVLDVRTVAEYAEGHLVGARHLDVNAPNFQAQAALLDPHRTYFLYCRSGNRSDQAGRALQALGITEVYNAGGFAALEAAGLPTTTDP